MEAKGVAVAQLGTGDGAGEGSRPAAAGYREGTGWRHRNRVRRALRDVPATQGGVPYPS